jgi:hypothetical protein
MNTLAAFGFRPHLASMADMESVAVRAAMCPRLCAAANIRSIRSPRRRVTIRMAAREVQAGSLS